MKSLAIAAAAAAVLVASAAAAQNAPKPVSRTDYVKNLDNRFAQVDSNHDGFLSAAELATLQQRELNQAKNMLQQQAQARFKQLDTNKDGQLSPAEFAAIAPAIRTSETPQQALQALDSNHDGKLSAEEFRAPQVAKFNKADANHDGTVTPAEAQAAAGKK
jgi:Ca2+-binding EF-hand superfamily protein